MLQIPVLPHVKKLLISMYGEQPLYAKDNNLLGKQLEHILADFPLSTIFEEQKPLRMDHVEIVISQRLKKMYDTYEGLFSLGCFFEKTWHRLLHQHIIAQARCGRRVKVSIADFYALYGITDDDYAITSAEMSYYDMVKKLKGSMKIIHFSKGRPSNELAEA